MSRMNKVNRCSAERPCPICGGWDDLKRGRGERCYGFQSEDGEYARCTREEHAGHAPFDNKSNAYVHKIRGECKCGVVHRPELTVVSPGRDPRPARAPRSSGEFKPAAKIESTYDYRDATGNLVYQVVRMSPKSFRQRRPDGKGGWLWNLQGIEPLLYRMPELLAADPRKAVYVCEGEKDVDALVAEGLVATTNSGGAGKFKDEHAKHLDNRIVIIVPDNDPVNAKTGRSEGRAHAEAVARSLVGIARSIKVVDLAKLSDDLGLGTLPDKGDVSDFLELGGTVEDLRAAAERATEFVAPKADAPHSNEGPDDPDRLAGVFMDKRHAHDDGPTIRYWRDEWHLWWDGCYSVVGEGEVTALIARATKAEFDRLNYVETVAWEKAGRTGADGKPCPRPVCRKVTRNLVSNVAQALRARVLLESSVSQPSWLGDGEAAWPPEEVLPARNGLVHLRTLVEGKPDAMLPPTPRFFIGHSLDYDFRVDAPEPVRWFEFLESLWPSDPETIQLLQEWFGLNLTSDTTFQKILMAIGPPRCGKGTIIRVLKGMVGAANVCSPTLGSLATNFGLAPLLGKPTGVIADARLSGRSDLAQVAERLLSISGEDPVTVDRKHLSAITCVLPTRLVIVSNEMPRFSEASGALTNRMLIMQFTRSFLGKEDRTLTASLMRELPGILLWSCEGWRRLMERGHFVQPGSGEELRESLEEMSSPTATFVKEMCVVGVEREVSVSELFEAWKQWCADKGRDHVGDQFRFGRDLKAAVPSITKVQHRLPGNRRERFYGGIGLTRDLDF